MQQEILAKRPGAGIRVYTVWFNMLLGDSREGWDSSVLPDPRVAHFWDGQRLLGHWFAAQGGADGVTWDHYWLYGPTARWDTTPGPLVGDGGPIIAQADQLRQQIGPLLAP